VSGSLKYEEMDSVSHAEAERVFSSGDCERIARALVALGLHDRDWKWVQVQCLRFLRDRSEIVVSAAILALAHTARVNRALDRDIVANALTELAADVRYAGKVQDALDDISIFVRGRRKAGAKGTDRKGKVQKKKRVQARSEAQDNGQGRKKRGTPSVTG
jgi:hypothetical protein